MRIRIILISEESKTYAFSPPGLWTSQLLPILGHGLLIELLGPLVQLPSKPVCDKGRVPLELIILVSFNQRLHIHELLLRISMCEQVSCNSLQCIDADKGAPANIFCR